MKRETVQPTKDFLMDYREEGEVSPCARTVLRATPSAGAPPPQRPRWGGQPPQAPRLPIKSYVLRGGRMSDAQKRSYTGLASRYVLPFAETVLDFEAVFGNKNPVTVEIGFGMGIATAIIAQDNPGKNYLGIEVFRPGIGRLLWEIEKRRLSNIRIIEHDAVEVNAEMIPPASLGGIHIFFPDPWPKKRHHKRRLVKRPVTDLLARRLDPSGYIYMVTDWAEYGDWALEELSRTPGLVNPHGGFAPPQAWRPRTKFETKGLEKNHEVRELLFTAEAP